LDSTREIPYVRMISRKGSVWNCIVPEGLSVLNALLVAGVCHHVLYVLDNRQMLLLILAFQVILVSSKLIIRMIHLGRVRQECET
jgi:hypothetical protein